MSCLNRRRVFSLLDFLSATGITFVVWGCFVSKQIESHLQALVILVRPEVEVPAVFGLEVMAFSSASCAEAAVCDTFSLSMGNLVPWRLQLLRTKCPVIGRQWRVGTRRLAHEEGEKSEGDANAK